MYGTGFLPTEEVNIYRVEPAGTTSTSPGPPRCRSPGSTWARSWRPTRSRSATRATRPAFAARPARPARTRAGCSASTSSTRSRCSSSAAPEASADEHERLLAIEEELVQALGLPYRVVNVAAGDLGASATKKYDIEAWFPSQGRYREITSTSNTTDFQARRLDVRFRGERGLEPVHTLNGTAVTARHMLALLENFQDEDGSVAVPEVLHPYGAPSRVER